MKLAILRHVMTEHMPPFLGGMVCCLVWFGTWLRLPSGRLDDIFLGALLSMAGVTMLWFASGLGSAIRCLRDRLAEQRRVESMFASDLDLAGLERRVDMADSARPNAAAMRSEMPLVQRISGGFRVTFLSPDSERAVALTLPDDYAHDLVNKIHEGLYG